MSESPDDYAYDSAMADLYEEHYEEAIEEFQYERLRSFYLENPYTIEKSYKALEEAKKLLEQRHYTASFIFASIAIEVGIKSAIIKPLIYGIVNNNLTASLITDLTMKNSSIDKFKKFIFNILLDKIKIDISTYKMKNSNISLWEEIQNIQKLRNVIMHRAEYATLADAKKSIEIASFIIDDLFQLLLKSSGFHLHNDLKICDKFHPKEIDKYLSDSKLFNNSPTP